jgi:hypothetical protein
MHSNPGWVAEQTALEPMDTLVQAGKAFADCESQDPIRAHVPEVTSYLVRVCHLLPGHTHAILHHA